MTMDTTITVGEISLPAGVTTGLDPDLPVVTVLVMRSSETEEEAAEETEGDAVEAAAGDADEAAGDDAAE
jgi:hypothetical protein